MGMVPWWTLEECPIAVARPVGHQQTKEHAVSDEGPDIGAANDAARDGGDTEESRGSGGRTAVVTEPVLRPQRPTGKRSRQRVADADDSTSAVDVESPDEAEAAEEGKAKKGRAAKKAQAG